MKTIEEKARAYDIIIEKANKMHSENCEACQACIEELIPELAESEEKPNGGIVREDFIQGDGWYKVNLDYLSKAQVEEIEQLVEKWNPKKVSEEEKIKKAILIYLDWLDGKKDYLPKGDYTIKDMILWLERQGEHANFLSKIQVGDKVTRNENGVLVNLSQLKRVAKPSEEQGEQKPQRMISAEAKEALFDYENANIQQKDFAPKVEPKFKVGDWVVQGCNILKIRCVGDEYYCFETVGGYVDDMLVSEIDSLYHLWAIQDAKDGDVLWHSDTASHGTFIFKQIRYDGKVLCYCDYDSEDHFCTGEHHTCCWSSDKCIKPATKEQRDLLFSKMNEAGYEWDFKKKELKKIEDEHQLKEGKFYECIKSYHNLGGSQYWFDKGKVYFCEKDGYLRSDPNNLIKVYNCENWQSYFRPYTENPAWSEEDEKMLDSICISINEESIAQGLRSRGVSHSIEDLTTILSKQINWLKSLKERIGGRV